ncbi:hypothetical protein DFP92_111145 [Yoonia sediminilitoris]|uniref:CBU-0592-like domain-containing protein n=1 Tax=Yoonia sediminilitoris TaxID=1286148 RepID=A0A2T6KBC0_9RHOB|nr:hypothetical protein C8N45_111146 [Yoonia sediminilitoris]RCW92996.1 hypothetical protein DFP92_111145 [Yoonia sediminilitoris]
MAGFGLYVLNDLYLTLDRLTAAPVAYFAINGVAALMGRVGMTVSFNLPSALIRIFWIMASALAIFIRLRRPAQADVFRQSVG